MVTRPRTYMINVRTRIQEPALTVKPRSPHRAPRLLLELPADVIATGTQNAMVGIIVAAAKDFHRTFQAYSLQRVHPVLHPCPGVFLFFRGFFLALTGPNSRGFLPGSNLFIGLLKSLFSDSGEFLNRVGIGNQAWFSFQSGSESFPAIDPI
jgi:hypothetical protein